jgi:hypothetical protein
MLIQNVQSSILTIKPQTLEAGVLPNEQTCFGAKKEMNTQNEV